MTTTLKVGKLEITSDTTKTNAEFTDLVDSMSVRLAKLVALDLQLEIGQPAATAVVPSSAAPALASTAVQTVTAV
jgi:hypothetical protein